MAYWVRNQVIFYMKDKNEAEKLMKLLKSDEIITNKTDPNEIEFDKSDFDFNKLVPMPEDIRKTAFPHRKTAFPHYIRHYAKRILGAMHLTGRKRITRNFLEQEGIDSKKYFEDVKKAVNNYNKYGCYYWYDWSLKYWGTERNAYNVELDKVKDTEIEYFFDTVMTMPVKILQEVSQIGLEGKMIWRVSDGQMLLDDVYEFESDLKNGFIVKELSDKEKEGIIKNLIYGIKV